MDTYATTLINSLPRHIKETVYSYIAARRTARRKAQAGEGTEEAYHVIQAEWEGYIKALRDAGVITQTQQRYLHFNTR